MKAGAGGPAPERLHLEHARGLLPIIAAATERIESGRGLHLQTRVRIEGVEGHSRMEIHFHGPEELDRVARTILEGRRA